MRLARRPVGIQEENPIWFFFLAQSTHLSLSEVLISRWCSAVPERLSKLLSPAQTETAVCAASF